MVTGNFRTFEVTIANGGHGELDLSSIVSTEKEVRIHPGATGVRLLLTPATSTDVADVQDFLLDNDENIYEIGRGLDRLSFYNGNGGQVKVSVAVLF